jgi:hypothetical protein
MTGLAGLLTPGSTSDATFPGCARKRGCSAGSLTLTTKESLLEFGHLGLEHLDLGLQFLGTLDGALMLAAMIMSLLTQSDYFGLQQPIPLLSDWTRKSGENETVFCKVTDGKARCPSALVINAC